MALGVTQDTSVLAILKEYYGVQDVEALVFRNSPVLGKIKKERIGGKYIPLPMAVYGNGAVTSDYTQVTNQAASSYLGVAMQVTPGRLFASYVLDPEEFLASKPDRGAFMSVFAIRTMLAMDDLRKVLATCLYNTGYLEQGVIRAVDTNFLYVDVDPSTAMALVPATTVGAGSQIIFAPTPSGTLRSATAIGISSIVNQPSSGYTRITFSSAYASSVAVGDYLMLKGGRDANASPNAPVGLEAWLPTVANRTGATWTTYIATLFYGVNRSTAPDRMAGQFVQRNSGETYTACLLRLLKQVRRGGGVPDLIIVNDDDFGVLMNDALANRTFYQNIQGAVAKDNNIATNGITQFQMHFSTSWINLVYDDPYCPKGKAYILDTESVRLYSLSNATKILDKLPIGNEPGAPKADDEAEPTTNFQFLVDDFYTTSWVDLASGKGLRVDFSLFANFAVVAPAHNGVAIFAA
jgi:hypothetical protein